MQQYKISVFLIATSLVVAGCGDVKSVFDEVVVPPRNAPRAKPRPDDLKAVKTVTAEEVQEATAKPEARPARDLGLTIVSLGLLDRDGLWLRTPLVKDEVPGRVIYSKLGNSANVTLLPIAGEVGAGSQLSLAAMQVLGVPLAELAEVQVYIR